MADAKISLEIGTYLNKQDLNSVKQDIEKLLGKIRDQKMSAVDPKQKKELKEQLEIVEKISESYDKAFDSKTGALNISKLNQEMRSAHVTVEQFYKIAKKSGEEGTAAYNGWANGILNANIQLKQSNKLLDRMAVTLKNTVRYGISSSMFNTFTNSVQKAYNYTKNLDTSLNDIRIVSSQSADQMERLAVSANRAAKELGKTTLDYTKAATIYYQQGLSSDEVEKRTEATLKAANVTGQNAQDVSEQLTAVWNGYRVTGEELELYVDRLAAVAAHSASNLEELSTGMSKVASAANLMGVDIDQLTAQMSTIISVTRQAPESVGTALRTIYARIADIKAGLDDDTSLGNYSGKMAKLGFNVLDASGNLREMGDVIEEIGGKWQDLSREQQISLAQTMAGTRQYNNLLTLFDNWDKYTDALETSKNSAGELQRQQDIYMESTAAHLQQLQATAEETYSELFDQKSARDFIDLVTGGLSTINKYLNGLNSGALGGVLGQLGALGANLFSSQIASGISSGLANRRSELNNLDIFNKQKEILDRGMLPSSKDTENSWAAQERYVDNRKNLLEAKRGLGVEEYQKLVEKSKELAKIDNEIADLIDKWNVNEKALNEKTEQYKKQLEEIDSLTNKQKTSKEGLTEEEEKRLATLKEETKEIEKLKQERDTLASSENGAKIFEYQEGQQAIDDALRMANEQQRINNIIRGTTALLGTWNNLWAGINIATDENLSTWEKFQGLLGVAGTQTMLLLTSYQSLSQLLPSIIVQMKMKNAETGKEITLEEASNLVKKQGIIASLGQMAANLKNIITIKGKTLAEWQAIAAENAETVAVTILKAVMGDFSGVTVLAVAAVAALTAALVAGAAAIIDANSGLNYYNREIDKAAENTKKAKEEFNEIKETFDAYKEARNSIDGLTVGTLEYYDAMVKANEEAQKLIDTLGLIAGVDYTVSNGGLIQISDEKLKELQFKEQQRVYRANAIEQQKRYEKAEYIRQQKGKQLQKDVIKYEEDNGLREKKPPVQEQNRLTKESQKTMGEKLPLYKSNVAETKTDITEYEVPAKAAYSQAEAEALTLKRMLADQIIRGYTSELDISTYDAMDSVGKKIMQDAVNKEKDAKKNNAAFEQEIVSLYEGIPLIGDLYSGLGQWWADLLPNDGFGKFMSMVLPAIPGVGIFAGPGAYDKFQEKEIKETYMREALGMKDEEITKEARDKIDLDVALEAIRSGTIEGAKKGKELAKIYRDSTDMANENNLSKSAQKYYGNFMMANREHDMDAMKENWNKLTTDERNTMLNLYPGTESNLSTMAEKEEFSWMKEPQSEEDLSERNIEDTEAYNQVLSDQAEILGTTSTALKLYAGALKNANKLTNDNKQETAEAAAESYKFNKAFGESRKAYTSNKDAINKYAKAMQNGEEVSYDVADATGKVVDQLKDMGIVLTSDDFKDAKTVENLNKLLEGTEEEAAAAYKALEAISTKNMLEEAFSGKLDTDKYKADIEGFASYLSNLKFDSNGMATLDSEWSSKLIDMVNKSKMTLEEAEKLFQEAHLEMPTPITHELEPETKNVPVPGYKTTHHYDGTMVVPRGGLFGGFDYEHVNYSWDEWQDDYQASYVTFDKNSTVKSNGGKKKNFTLPSNQGGGKKSGGSKAKPSKKDPNKEELDRYQKVNVQLKEIGKQLTALDKQKKKLLGGDLVRNLNDQVALLDKQIDVTREKLKIAQGEQSEVAGTLSKYGIKFDSEGNIANYQQIFKQEQAKLNAVYAKFNGMSKAAQESYQDVVKAAEENWKTFKDSISKYDNLIGETIPGLYQEIQDAYDKQTENLIEQFNMEIKIRLDMTEATREWNDFKRKVIDGIKDDDILGTARARLKDFSTYYNDENTGEVQKLTERVRAQLEEIRKQEEENGGEWYRDNNAQAFEDLKEYYEKLKEGLTDIVELEEEMHQKFLDSMDEAQDKFDEQVDTFEDINKHLDHNIELINLLTDQNDYDRLAEQYAAQTRNRQEELNFYTQQKDFWENYLNTLKEGSEEWENAKAKYNEAAEAWASALETTIQAARTEFENNLNAIFKAINNQLTNNKGLDYINEEWELISANSELALDNINRMQGIQEITRKYNDAINGTSSVKAQQKLAELRDKELESLKAMGHLSEQDLERAEKKLDIVKAQIALEDAQRNKSQMRLRRDTQGNYRYQFVADEDEINQAQQNLYAAYNELYNFDKTRYINNLNEAAQAWQEYQEKMAEAALINDPEVRAEKEALIKEQYNEKIGILHEQLQRTMSELNESTFAELNALYAENEANYDLMTEEQKAALNDFNSANQTAFDLVFDLYTDNTEKFHNMAQDQIDVIQNQMVPQWVSGYQALVEAIEGEGGIEEVSNRMMDEIQTAIDKYNNSLAETQVNAGNTFEAISSAQSKVIENTQKMLEDNGELITKYRDMINEMKALYCGEDGESGLVGMMNQFKTAADQAKTAAEEAYNKIHQMSEEQAKAAGKNVNDGAKPESNGSGGGDKSGGNGGGNQPNSAPAVGSTITLPTGTYFRRSDGSTYPNPSIQGRQVEIKSNSGNLWKVYSSALDPNTVYIKKSDIGYDTGGYTGEWGNDGRLALLHQKELVLNKEDTANMLNAVEIMRGITDNIGADILGRMASLSSGSLNTAVGGSAMEQNVHIEATFPGVQSSIEIQDALTNLVNAAAQRALTR